MDLCAVSKKIQKKKKRSKSLRVHLLLRTDKLQQQIGQRNKTLKIKETKTKENHNKHKRQS